jgi:hypothetical protein
VPLRLLSFGLRVVFILYDAVSDSGENFRFAYGRGKKEGRASEAPNRVSFGPGEASGL